MSKSPQIIFLVSFLAIVGCFLSQEAHASCADISLSGNYTITASCSFAGTVNGIEEGNLTINSDQTLTIVAGQTIVFNPGYSVFIQGSMVITKTPVGGQLKKAYIWLKDADNDSYPDETTSMVVGTSATAPPFEEDGKRRSDNAFTVTRGWTHVNGIAYDLDDTNACAQLVLHECGDPNNNTGECNIKPLQCLTACKRCGGNSIDVSYAPTNGQVCLGGGSSGVSWTTPSLSAYCDWTINCVSNECSAPRYYRGCTAGLTSCHDASKIGNDAMWIVNNNSRITETKYKSYATGTPACNQSSGRCYGPGSSSCSCSTPQCGTISGEYWIYESWCQNGTCTDASYQRNCYCTGAGCPGPTTEWSGCSCSCPANCGTNVCTGTSYSCVNYTCQSSTGGCGSTSCGSNCPSGEVCCFGMFCMPVLTGCPK